MSKSENQCEHSPLESQINIAFDAWCDCCGAEFLDINHDYDYDFLKWVKREADIAKRQGWTETKIEVFCPNCDKGAFLEKLKQKRIRDSKKAKAAVLSATRKTLMQKLSQIFKNRSD